MPSNRASRRASSLTNSRASNCRSSKQPLQLQSKQQSKQPLGNYWYHYFVKYIIISSSLSSFRQVFKLFACSSLPSKQQSKQPLQLPSKQLLSMFTDLEADESSHDPDFTVLAHFPDFAHFPDIVLFPISYFSRYRTFYSSNSKVRQKTQRTIPLPVLWWRVLQKAHCQLQEETRGSLAAAAKQVREAETRKTTEAT